MGEWKDDVLREVGKILDKMESLEKQNKSKDLTIFNLENVVKNQDNKIDYLQKNVKEYEKKNDELQTQLSNYKTAVKNYKNELEKNSIEIEGLKNKIEEIKDSIILSKENRYSGGRSCSLQDEEVEQIRVLLKLGINQKEIAELKDTSQSTVSRISNNKYNTKGIVEEVEKMEVVNIPKDKQKLERSIFALKSTMRDDLKIGDTKSYEMHKQALDVYEKALKDILSKEEQFTEDTTDFFSLKGFEYKE